MVPTIQRSSVSSTSLIFATPRTILSTYHKGWSQEEDHPIHREIQVNDWADLDFIKLCDKQEWVNIKNKRGIVKQKEWVKYSIQERRKEYCQLF
jgi:hypothetical protein